jgi:hypothetical protein
VFRSSITQRPKPPARRAVAPQRISIRVLSLAILGVISSGYALVRHYTRTEPPRTTETTAPREHEIPAPELVPLER